MADPDRPWDEPKPSAEAAPKAKSPVKAWQIIVGLVIVAGIFGAVNSGGGSEPDQYGAQTACQDRVKTLLKSPSSAKFSDVVATEAGADTWTVTGSVDSDNSFGAAIRGSFTCKAESDDGETWTTSRVSIN